MFFGGGGIPFGMDGDMPGGMGGMGRSREPADTQALYDVLGVTKKATQSEITRVSKPASEKHPDKGGDVEEFKKIQAAYEVLGDEEKRSKYDQYGFEGLEGGDMPEGMDIFDMFFGGGRRRRGGGGGKRKAEDTVYPLKVVVSRFIQRQDREARHHAQCDEGRTAEMLHLPRARSGDPDAPDRPGHGPAAPSEVSRPLGRL